MVRIGILGGTFDPPHIGHLVLADCAIESLSLDRLLFVPAADPPHKPGETRAEVGDRLAMLQRAITADSRFEFSSADVDRPGPHYTVDLIRILQACHPGADLYFVMGSDSFRDLPTWHTPKELVAIARFAVMQRPGASVALDMHEAVLPGLARRTTLIDAPSIELSSTEIVERLCEGKSVRYLVPDTVLQYIKSRQVYQE